MSTDSPTRTVARLGVHFGLSPAELLGRSRAKSVTFARSVICYALRALHGMSYPEIGVMVQRDHTTVMHGVKRAELATGHEQSRVIRALRAAAGVEQ